MNIYAPCITAATSNERGLGAIYSAAVLFLMVIAWGSISCQTGFSPFLPNKVVGSVVAADTGGPVSGAMVAVESSSPGDEEGFGRYVRTNKDGRFAAEIKGARVSIRVWKPGYSLQGLSFNSEEARHGEVIIKLREMTKTNWLTARDSFFELKPGNGFSFDGGEVVSDGPNADVGFYQPAGSKSTIIIRAAGEGGLILRRADGEANFTNSPVAPLTGYEKELTVNFADKQGSGVYFYVRTRDGAHYAKFSFSVSSRIESNNEPSLDFEQPVRITWAYQPDGTRNLEITPDKNTPFPFEEFGVDRNHLDGR